MNQLLKCSKCEQKFDTDKYAPRILTCNKLICTNCILAAQQLLGGFKIEDCVCSSRVHLLSKLDEAPISQLSVLYLKNQSQNLNDLIQELKYSFELAKFDLTRHYDDMQMKIDIKAETLIDFVHDARSQLHADIKVHRLETNAHLARFESCHREKLNSIERVSSNETKIDFSQFVKQLNEIQQSLEEIKKKSWYFVENTTGVDKSLLGLNFNSEIDKNYFKIKNINSLIKTQNHQLNLKSKFNEYKLRSFIVPINRKRFLICYFTKSKGIYLELFDSSGESVKVVLVEECATYYPLIASHNDYFVLHYTSKPDHKHMYETYDDSSTGYLSVYDADMNLLRTIVEKTVIESIFINKSRVVCLFAHKSHECCKMFDLELNFIGSFGQQIDSSQPFYIEKIDTNLKYFSKEKMNPTIFGVGEDYVYLYDKKSMTLMSRHTGRVEKLVGKMNEKSYFVLDSQSNVIEINPKANHIRLHNFHLDLIVDSMYEEAFEYVHLIEDQYLAFVSNKDTIKIV